MFCNEVRLVEVFGLFDWGRVMMGCWERVKY